MSTVTIYNILVDLGVDKAKAREAAELIVTHDQAREFATKADLNQLRSDMYRALLMQTGAIIAAIAALGLIG